jgi:hypothetical protein
VRSMAVIFVNEKGRELFLSESVLRRDLSLLQNTQVEEISGISLDVLEGPLGTVFSKLNISIKKISSVDVETYFKRLLDIEDLSFIFSLSRTHFLAIVYLLYEGIMTIDDVKSLIRNDYYTRNEILMIKLSGVPQDPSSDLMLAFKESIKILEKSRSKKSIRNNLSNLYSLNESVRLIPDHFYALKGLFSRSNFSNFDSFSNTNWLIDNSIAIDGKEKNRGYNSASYRDYNYFKNIVPGLLGPAFFLIVAAVVNPIGWLLSIPAIVIIALVGYTAIKGFFDYKDYTSYLDYLKKTSRFKDIPGRLINSDKVIDMLMNRFFSEEIRKVYLTRTNYPNNNEESIFSSNSLNNNSMNMFLRNSISYSISDENNLSTDTFKPRYISYFHFLYWMYENKGNNFSTMSNFNYSDYEVNPNNIYRLDVENSSLNNTIYNFEYLNDNLPLKNTLLNLFPETESLKRSDQSYIRRYFLDSFTSSSVTNSLYSLSSNRTRIINSLNKILENDFLLANNGSISSLGRFGRTNYTNEAIRIALESIDFEATDVSALSSFTNAQTYFNSIKTSVKNSIISQTSSNNNQISSQPSNDIFKLFLGDLVDSYFSYLVNGTNEVFAPVVSQELMKTYRALNFLKHTFISMESFVTNVKDNISYKNLMMLMLSVNNNLQLPEMEQIYKGGVTISEIETLFKKLAQNNNSASFISTSGGSGGSTGGGGSGTRSTLEQN